MPTEDQSRPPRDLRGLWLLPILALGLGVFVASWKKPVPQPPAEFVTAEQAKSDAYRYARYSLVSHGALAQPKGFTLIGSAPYSSDIVTKLGPDRFRCSSSLTVRSPSGEVQKERWQCVITGTHNDWSVESFEHMPPERIISGVAQTR